METLGGGIEVRRRHDRKVRYVPQSEHSFCSLMTEKHPVVVFSMDAFRGFEVRFTKASKRMGNGGKLRGRVHAGILKVRGMIRGSF